MYAEHVYAVMDQSPFPWSPLNGHTVRNQDMVRASEANPVRPNVIEHICVGAYPRLKVGPGEAVRVMTGVPIPEGMDGVTIQERADEGSESIGIYQSVTAYGDYCKRGEDIHRGALLMEKGRSIRPSHIGTLSNQGIESILVYSVPAAGIMTVGDELVPMGTPLGLGKIYDSNEPFLAARIKELGMKPLLLGREGDDTVQLAREIRKRLTECDTLTTSSSVSLGIRDCMPYVVGALGADVLFHGINVKPGSPMLVILVKDKSVFCLSGSPSAAVATFEVLVRPILERVCERVR